MRTVGTTRGQDGDIRRKKREKRRKERLESVRDKKRDLEMKTHLEEIEVEERSRGEVVGQEKAALPTLPHPLGKRGVLRNLSNRSKCPGRGGGGA